MKYYSFMAIGYVISTIVSIVLHNNIQCEQYDKGFEEGIKHEKQRAQAFRDSIRNNNKWNNGVPDSVREDFKWE